MLKSIEFDIIKIDQLFIDKISSQKNLEIIKMVLKISNISDKTVITEGVETKEQKETLLSLGCNLHQNFYY